MVEAADQEKRAGFVALIGAPNVGKSTLLNALVGAKISIVTPKVQTTRMRVRGIAIDGAAQLIFVDTPGIFSPRRRLDRAMVGSAWASTQDADVVALLIDAKKGVKDEDEAILGGLAEVRPPKVLVLNKVDLVDKQVLPEFGRIVRGAAQAKNAGLEVHAGHGLDFVTAEKIAELGDIAELNIGHFLIGEAIFESLGETVRLMRSAMDRGRSRTGAGS